MNTQLIIVIAIAASAVLAAFGMMLVNFMREKRQAKIEDSVAKAAQEYLSRFEIRARIVAVTLPDNRVVLMVETPPHKKLRFSFIIEQPIKQFILKQTKVEVDRIFWRFPMPAKGAASEVQYGSPTTQAMLLPQAGPSEQQSPAAAPAPAEDDDEYFHRQSYQIEEVSWEDFSTVSKPNSENGDRKK